MDILQKVDYEHNSGTISEYFFTGGPPAPQPVQSFGSTAIQYVVTNESDCGIPACTSPVVEVDAFTGTPEGVGGVMVTASFPAMTATAVDDSTFFLPPADQKGTAADPADKRRSFPQCRLGERRDMDRRRNQL